MKLLIFGRQTCPACQSIKEKLEYFSEKHTPIPIEYYDVETVDGLAESAYRSIPDIPTVILMKDEKEIKRWVQTAPIFSELKDLLVTDEHQ
jgi:thiol-disulfide isomerase/thioredoxin